MFPYIINRCCELMQFRIYDVEIAEFVWIFTFYNFLGWLYESTIFSLGEQGRFINKGYFIGPYCPIYGIGFFLNYFMLYHIKSTMAVFLISMSTCTGIEYATSYVLEKKFHVRYWDYHYYPLNIDGRVSLPSSFFFGITITFMMRIVTPFFINRVQLIPRRILYVTAVLFIVILLLDCIITYICLQNLNEKCRAMYDAWDDYVDGKLDILNEKKDELDKYVVVRQGKNLMVKAKSVNKKCVEMQPLIVEKMRFILHDLLGIDE